MKFEAIAVAVLQLIYLTNTAISFGTTETPNSDTTDILGQECAKYNGSFLREASCCKSKYIKRPVEGLYVESKFDSCLKSQSKLKENVDEDLPTLLWKAYFCVFEKSSVFTEGNVKFSSFVDFLTKEYGSELRDEIRAANSECAEAEAETEDWKKVRKFSECFYRNEKKVCHKPTIEGLDIAASNKQIGEKIGLDTTCSPLEGSYKSYDDCCKNTSTPMALDLIFVTAIVNYPRSRTYPNTNLTAVEQCEMAFTKRRNELHAKKPLLCKDACTHSPMIYDGVDSLKLDKKLTSLYFKEYLTEHQQQTIDKLIQKILNARVNFSFADNKTITFIWNTFGEELRNTTDELTKIDMYCLYHESTPILIETAFRMYCTDNNWGSRWFHEMFNWSQNN